MLHLGPFQNTHRAKVIAMGIGINVEFVRHSDKSFEYGGQKAADLGYRYIEPCFLMGTCLLSNAGYCHFRSLDTDPHYFKDFCHERV